MTENNDRSEEKADPARFTSVIRNELCAMQYQSDVRARSCAPSLSGLQAGSVDVLRYRGLGEQWGGRDQGLIHANRADYYVVCAPVSARLTVRQNGWDAQLRPGYCTFVSTIRPFSARIRSEVAGDFFSAMHVRVPGALLRQRIPDLDEVCGREIRVLPGSARMMLSLFDIALSDGPFLPDDEKRRLGGALLEVISVVAMELSDSTPARMPGRTAHQRTFDCAKDFIACRLSDPDLDPAGVAGHCGVSTRYLHASFAAFSTHSVAHFIRENRLQGCHSALTSQKLRHRTIIDIAGDWGFDDPAHFCRVYKARFGRTPREDRFGRTSPINA